MKNISKALLEAQKKIENATKDGKNPHFKSKYATLESVLDAVKTIANECGVVIVQGNESDQFGQYVGTKLIHGESGECIESKVYLVLDKNNMQGLGSAITYARRYGLAAMFAIGQDDDDGNEASKGTSTQTQKPIPTKPPVSAPKSNFSPRPQPTKPVVTPNGYPAEWDQTNFNQGE
jgi:hypothetical protein